VLVLGKDGRIASANAAAVRLAGSDAAPLEGKELSAVAEALAVLRHGPRHATGGSVSFRTGVRARAAPCACGVTVRRRGGAARGAGARGAAALPPPRPPSVEPARLGEVLAGAAACVKTPVARAAPPPRTCACSRRALAARREQLSLLDAALEEAARRVAELHDAAEKAAGVPRALELMPLVPTCSPRGPAGGAPRSAPSPPQRLRTSGRCGRRSARRRAAGRAGAAARSRCTSGAAGPPRSWR
jgi:hypothetical protein